MELFLGILLLIAALILIVAVLMQSGKTKGLSGSVAGAAESFFGKTKGAAIDKTLSKVTLVVAIIFAVLVVVVYVIQDDTDIQALLDSLKADAAVTTAATPDETDIDNTVESGDADSADTAAETANAEETADPAADTEPVDTKL